MAKTLFDKIWDSHVITDLGNGFVLLHIDRLLLHDLSGARALRDVMDKGYTPAQPRLIYATPDHAISTMPGPHRGDLSARRAAAEGPAREHQEIRHPPVRHRQGRQRHRPYRRPRAGPDPARHDPGLRRQPYLHPWRHGLARLRHRLVGAGARAGDADHGAAQAQALPRPVRGQGARGRDRQGHDPAPDRRRSARRRHRPCGRVCRLGGPRPDGRRPAHALQSLDRDGRAHRHGGARRHHLRVPRRPRLLAQGRDVGPRRRALAHACRPIPTPTSTASTRSTWPRWRRRSPGAPAPSM